MDPRRSPTSFPELRRDFPSDAGGAYLEKRPFWTDFPAKNVRGSAAAAGQMCRLRPRCVSRAALGRARRDFLNARSGLSAMGASTRRWRVGDTVRDPQCADVIARARQAEIERLDSFDFEIERHERVNKMAILTCIGASVPARHTPC